jgi:hypothetical protein
MPKSRLQITSTVSLIILQAKQERKKITTTVNVERFHGNDIWFLSYSRKILFYKQTKYDIEEKKGTRM